MGTLIQQVAAERPLPGDAGSWRQSPPDRACADADLDAALPAVINAIVQNAGQTCSAGSRLLVDQAIYEPLLETPGRGVRESARRPRHDGPGRRPADPEPASSSVSAGIS